MEKYRKYISVSPEFLYSADKTYDARYDKEIISEEFHKISSYVTAPIITAYVMYILKQCIERKIKRIYFFSEIFAKTACLLCKNMNIGIECRYIGCSEESLSMALYNIAGNDAFDELLIKESESSAYSVLMRAGLSESERRMIYGEIGLDFDNEKNILSEDDILKLKSNEKLKSMLKEKSEAAYKNAKEYFIQEGFLADVNYAVAGQDTNVSRHDMLVRLVSDIFGKKLKFKGFYFGLNEKPESREYGEYICWYFKYNSPLKYKTRFNVSLFECLCADSHGKTKGYEKIFGTDKYIPVMSEIPETNIKLIEHQEKCAEAFAENLSGIFGLDKFNEAMFHTMTEKLLAKLMYLTNREEAEALGGFLVEDNGGLCKIAESTDVKNLADTLITRRISRHFSDDERGTDSFVWDYGTLALTEVNDKFVYRISFNLWDKAKFFINSI